MCLAFCICFIPYVLVDAFFTDEFVSAHSVAFSSVGSSIASQTSVRAGAIGTGDMSDDFDFVIDCDAKFALHCLTETIALRFEMIKLVLEAGLTISTAEFMHLAYSSSSAFLILNRFDDSLFLRYSVKCTFFLATPSAIQYIVS